jgi:hypothetical protein
LSSKRKKATSAIEIKFIFEKKVFKIQQANMCSPSGIVLVNKTVDTYIALIGSVIVYSINGTLDYIVISKIGLGSTVVSIGLGMLLGVVFLIPVFKSHLWPKKASYLLFSSSSAFFIVIYNLLLFIAYLKYDLAQHIPIDRSICTYIFCNRYH